MSGNDPTTYVRCECGHDRFYEAKRIVVKGKSVTMTVESTCAKCGAALAASDREGT